MSGRSQNMGALELAIGRVLQVGVVASSIALAVGLVLTLTGSGGDVTRLVLAGGLVILMATPAARVLVSLVEYVRAREWNFVAFTLAVLLALAGSVVAAFWSPSP